MFHISGIGDISVPAPTVDTQIVGAGQSWTNLWETTSFMYGFVATLQGAGAGNVLSNLAGYGGSSILEVNERTDLPPGTYFWADTPSNSYPGTWTDGPLITSGRALLNTRLSRGPTPTCLVWQQKEQDTINLDMSSATAARTEASTWKFGSYYTMLRLCHLWSPADPSLVTRYVHWERRMNAGFAVQMAIMRDAQFDLIALDPTKIFSGAENYDIPYPENDDHPLRADCYHPGFRMGLAVANGEFGASNPTGPSITSIGRPAANQIDIAINVEGGCTLRKPVSPVGFRVFPGSDYINPDGTTRTPIGITAFTWIGNTLRLTLDAAGQATVCYPWLDAGDLIYRPGGTEDVVIRYSNKLTEKDIGLPLRSIRATTVAA